MASIDNTTVITTTEMHTAGEPLRIIETGYPEIKGETVLDKRNYAMAHLDAFRKFLIFEPRGHFDMYGAVFVPPTNPDADVAVLFMHNAGYSTMCGHAIIALGKYVVAKGIVRLKEPETQVNIECPCGLVRTFVSCGQGKPGPVRFLSVPAFAFALDLEIEVEGFGKVMVDIGYGGAFYAIVPAQRFDLNVTKSRSKDLVEVATLVSESVRRVVTPSHPDSPDLGFLYGTILTDDKDTFQDGATENITVFADREVDRSPTGSGVTARLAVQFARGQIGLNQRRTFKSLIGSEFYGSVAETCKCGDFNAVVAEVSGEAFFTGSNTFTAELDDALKDGFLLK